MPEEIHVPPGLTTEGLIVRRYFARFIDSLVILMLFAILVLAYSVVATGAGPSPTVRPVFWLVLFFVWIGYGTVLESSRQQATLGKRLMGLRVYNEQGGRLGWMQAAGRNLIKDGPFLVVAMVPGGQMVLLVWLAAHLLVMHRSPVHQAIHDRAARTWVAAQEETTQLRIA